jgi:hypothetical protein
VHNGVSTTQAGIRRQDSGSRCAGGDLEKLSLWILPSPDGWTTIGEVSNGSRLYDEAGNICIVQYCTIVQYGRPCNLVTFDNGTQVVADDNHLWQVEINQQDSVILSTADIRRHSVAGQNLRILCARPAGINEREGIQALRERLKWLRTHIGSALQLVSPGEGLFICSSLERKKILAELSGIGLLVREAGSHFCFETNPRTGHLISSVVAIDSQPVRCLQVSSKSRLFLCTQSYIPTHNTFLMAEELRRAVRLAVRNNISADNEIWYGAPNFIQAKRVMWARLKRAIPRNWIDGRPNETNCSIRVQSGHVVRLVGLESSDNLRGSGLWFFGGDEWADCRPSAWNEVIRPMLSTAQGHALFIGTPKGFDHFRDAYILGLPGGDPAYRSFLFTTEDGGNVPAEELLAARREMDLRTYRQEYCASFETYAGRVIYAFSRSANIAPFSYDTRRRLHIGMDFNINPMSATVWQEDRHTTRQIDEIILPTSNTDEMADEIIRRYGRDGFDPGSRLADHITIYPDPAGWQRRSSAGGRTDVGILKERGFVVIVSRSHPPVRDRINIMNRQFQAANGEILATVDPRCARSIEAYERLVFREGTNEPDKTQGFDHLVDATGYYLHARSQNTAEVAVSSFMER